MTNDVTYYIGQVLGILVTICVIINMQLKQKKHMYLFSITGNVLSALNIYLLNGMSSGVIICGVAIFQLLAAIWHERKGTSAKIPEMIFFLALYLGGGIYGYNSPIDILTIIAALLYMIAMFQKKEQHIRMFLLGNMASWIVYHAILGSTAIFAQIAGITSTIIGLIRYRKK